MSSHAGALAALKKPEGKEEERATQHTVDQTQINLPADATLDR
jgi:hypothetical protein